MEQIDTLIGAMRGDHGWVLALTAWMTSSRIIFKWFSAGIQQYLAEALPNEKAWVEKVLSHWLYRLVAFLIDYITSIKLPAKDTLSTNTK